MLKEVKFKPKGIRKEPASKYKKPEDITEGAYK